MGRWKWFHFAQSRKTSINGPVLMQKAEEITKQLDHDECESPDGSFNCWKKKHDLCYTKLYGEAVAQSGFLQGVEDKVF